MKVLSSRWYLVAVFAAVVFVLGACGLPNNAQTETRPPPCLGKVAMSHYEKIAQVLPKWTVVSHKMTVIERGREWSCVVGFSGSQSSNGKYAMYLVRLITVYDKCNPCGEDVSVSRVRIFLPEKYWGGRLQDISAAEIDEVDKAFTSVARGNAERPVKSVSVQWWYPLSPEEYSALYGVVDTWP
jgi:hypothetical protein